MATGDADSRGRLVLAGAVVEVVDGVVPKLDHLGLMVGCPGSRKSGHLDKSCIDGGGTQAQILK